MGQEELASFNFALSIHAAAPRIEAHYHYYVNSLEPIMGRLYDSTCGVWLQWSHKQVCDTGGDFEDMLNSWERYRKYEILLLFECFVCRKVLTASLAIDGGFSLTGYWRHKRTNQRPSFMPISKPQISNSSTRYSGIMPNKGYLPIACDTSPRLMERGAL